MTGYACTLQSSSMMSLIIPDAKQSGEDIDVYLQPSVEELKKLWVDGLKTYGASRNGTFHMQVDLLWTINDFPAFTVLSGCSIKGS